MLTFLIYNIFDFNTVCNEKKLIIQFYMKIVFYTFTHFHRSFKIITKKIQNNLCKIKQTSIYIKPKRQSDRRTEGETDRHIHWKYHACQNLFFMYFSARQLNSTIIIKCQNIIVYENFNQIYYVLNKIRQFLF